MIQWLTSGWVMQRRQNLLYSNEWRLGVVVERKWGKRTVERIRNPPV